MERCHAKGKKSGRLSILPPLCHPERTPFFPIGIFFPSPLRWIWRSLAEHAALRPLACSQGPPVQHWSEMLTRGGLKLCCRLKEDVDKALDALETK